MSLPNSSDKRYQIVVLPEFTKSRTKLDEIVHLQMQTGIRGNMGMLGQISRRMIHEGDSACLFREDGTVDNIEMKRIKTEIQIPVEQAVKWTQADSEARIGEIAQDMAMQTAEYSYGKLNKVLTEVGNVVNAKGGKLTVEHFFEMIEKIEIRFTPNGVPVWPVAAGGMADQLDAMQETVANTPELLKRLHELVLKKREHWNAREADRTLVG